jgi:histidine ammonia-lyase
MPAAEALRRLGLEPLVLEAKEGLCLVNGTPCVTGLAALVLHRSSRTHELDRCHCGDVLRDPALPAACHRSFRDGAARVARIAGGRRQVEQLLSGSDILANAHGRKTQDALSLRAIPQVHGAVRDVWAGAVIAVDRELASCTDNPIVSGSPTRRKSSRRRILSVQPLASRWIISRPPWRNWA